MTNRQRTLLWQKIDIHPDLLLVHSAQPDRYPFLLESTSYTVGHNIDRNRYDILFAFPEETLVLKYSRYSTGNKHEIPKQDFLHQLDLRFAEEQDRALTSKTFFSEIPFRGGWFLYLGYESVAQIEPVLHHHFVENAQSHATSIETQFPIAAAWRIPAAIIRDKRKRETILIAEIHRAPLLAEMEKDLSSISHVSTTPPSPDSQTARLLRKPIYEDPPDEFLQRVAKIRRYIREGDVFQVNLSRGWHGLLHEGVTPAQIYARMRRYNPAPFAGLAVWDDFAVISSSPERLVHVYDGMVETRPIAGTHPRSQNPAADAGLSHALMAHPKERAEHIMLIDLERNDLGRICRPGSIEVNELMVLESYAHVHHIVSNIRGRLTPDATPGEVLRAVFPGGTITGCPKVHCMEIIAELEQTPRGPYTGAMGYLNRDGSADLNILIRTICQQGDKVSLRAGSGIVADSAPERELRETRHKARGPLRALLGS
uniref:Anthranilate synthase component 1 n=1 Tax=Candidatus Kentrum sp. TUN TaxID=2126343 RepID=A0A450ZEC2_9GAMM|nr:MAG: anthranilate synthase component 1 [Candidatus Kentron sp. TUN]VFK52163.1 MAG: anthranilate synthase component 1 [Candidatus Kentron sp. TUN]